MAHRLSKRAYADLDEIWAYLVRESQSEMVADRQIDAITSRFYLLANHPQLVYRPMQSFTVPPRKNPERHGTISTLALIKQWCVSSRRQLKAQVARTSIARDTPLVRARDGDLGHGRRSYPVDDYVIIYSA